MDTRIALVGIIVDNIDSTNDIISSLCVKLEIIVGISIKLK